MHYFGYGSNLSKRVMDHVCPGHDLVGSACLKDYRLGFTRFSAGWNGGVADIIPRSGEHVWGRLYRINQLCIKALDIKESVGVGYDRITVEVTTVEGTTYTAMSYAVINKDFDEFPAAPAYKATILEGANEAQFPESYMTMLRAIKIYEIS